MTRFNLKEGDEISEEFFTRILKDEERQALKNRLARILSYRDRTPKEIRERLRNLGYSDEIISEVIDEYIEKKIIDEERLVQSFIADYTNLNPRGNIFIKRTLLAKGIEAGLIDQYLKDRDEAAVIRRFLEKKRAKIKEQDRARIYRLLINRGFTPKVVSEVVGEEF